MPCRCCNAARPSKGFKQPHEQIINNLLREAAKLIIESKNLGYDDLSDWKKAWQEAFDHHLNGCPENESVTK